MDWKTLIVIIPLLPLAAFLLNGLFGRWIGRAGGWLAVLCMGGAAAIGAVLFLRALGGGAPLPIDIHLWNWMVAGPLNVEIAFHVDQLTCLMLFFVTLVSTLVFLYSMGYMAGDPGFNRFFAYLGLFDFSMLILVLGSSLPVLFVGWEGVGLCSYLLIGYYMSQPGAPSAGQKAFIVNRIGDFGFLVAMMMIFNALKTFNIQDIIHQAALAGGGVGGAEGAVNAAGAVASPLLKYGGAYVTTLTLMMFLGCCGKSAQIPLFIWLPDAMAGPTPVSALIHAATMVTAGVYLVVRMSALFALAPATMLTIAVIAALTAFVAGMIGLTQRDIKKVLAYSTVSQLGFMFLACGVGAFVAGIFHVFTHSFFKACLFLGAGSVIHACHHIQDLNQMGGLKNKMKITWLTFLLACLALAGVPPLAGFFSKDEILWQTFAHHQFCLYVIGVLTALMTAIYSFRVLFLAFHGKSRLPHDVEHHVHESPWTMTLPLIILAIGSVAAGFMNLPALFIGEGKAGLVDRFLEPIVEPAQKILLGHAGALSAIHSTALEWGLMLFSVAIALAGIYLAAYFILWGYPQRGEAAAGRLGFLYRLSANRWWWDDVYNVVFAGGLRIVARASVWFDRYIIDGILHSIAAIANGVSRLLRGLQNGQVQAYALVALAGINIIIWLVLWFK